MPNLVRRARLALAIAAGAVALAGASPSPAPAGGGAASRAALWNDAGHMAVAAIAYDRLEPAVRTQVDELLRRHPDYAALTRGLTAGGPDFDKFVFMRAATWPDALRGDQRFYSDSRPPNPLPPVLPGFPDMARHGNWHYINLPVSADGTPTRETPTPNALTQIVAFLHALGDPSLPEATRAYDLSWLLHMVGDIHQPLHAVARYSRLHPNGDAGGNGVRVRTGSAPGDTSNLHSFWDGVLGRDRAPEAAVELARRLMAETPPNESSETRVAIDFTLDETVQGWIEESATLSRYVVYTVGPEPAAGGGHVEVRPEYRAIAGSVARRRAALAGYRLANAINARLR